MRLIVAGGSWLSCLSLCIFDTVEVKNCSHTVNKDIIIVIWMSCNLHELYDDIPYRSKSLASFDGNLIYFSLLRRESFKVSKVSKC